MEAPFATSCTLGAPCYFAIMLPYAAQGVHGGADVDTVSVVDPVDEEHVHLVSDCTVSTVRI